MILFKLIHLFAVLIWVGGMFFAYIMLRPVAVKALQQPERLRLLSTVLLRFFNWAWVAIGILLVTGFFLIYRYGGIVHLARHNHIMLASGLAMMVIHGYVFFVCYVPFSVLVAKKRWEEAEKRLGIMRKLVVLNLLLGLLTIVAVKIAMAVGS